MMDIVMSRRDRRSLLFSAALLLLVTGCGRPRHFDTNQFEFGSEKFRIRIDDFTHKQFSADGDKLCLISNLIHNQEFTIVRQLFTT